MNGELRLEDLRELFLSAPDSDGVRLFAVAASFLLVAVVLWLVRRRSLQEEYTPIWMVVAFGLLVLSVRMDWLRAVTQAMGAWTTSSAVFFLGELFLVAICLNYAVRLSRSSLRLKNLAQQTALLQAQVDRLEAERSED